MAESPFQTSTKATISDTRLQATLKRARVHFSSSRARAYAALPQVAARRRRAALAKLRSLERLPELLSAFEANARNLGAQVYWAETGEDAAAYVADLCRAKDLRVAVKAKSMATEEAHFNEHLAESGVEVWETDLGAYIVQLAGEAPSHVIAPAVHKSQQEIAELFADKLGRTSETPEGLTAIAREVLRERFLAADVGISGANMAVAQSGSLVLFENEGNIRLTTSCPPVHVALVGIEKLVTSMGDVLDIMQMLPRSATGQLLSTYVSLISGPRRTGEADGPEELHIVLMDNGRSTLYADPLTRPALACLRCGACLTMCPIFGMVGGHAYPGTYPGPIGSILTPVMRHAPGDAELPFACTGCGACAEVCPVEIDHPRILLELRRRLAESVRGPKPGSTPLSGPAAAAYAWAAEHPWAYRGAVNALRTLDPSLALLGRLPLLKAWSRARSLPRLQTPYKDSDHE